MRYARSVESSNGPNREPVPAPAAVPRPGVVRRTVVDPILALLKQGATPRLLAWSIAIGLVIGIFPIVGTTTVLCVAIAVGLRLNVAAMQVANHLVYPLQILLLIPFVRLGERLAGAERLPLTLEKVQGVFAQGLVPGVTTLATSLGHAVAGWAVAAPFACGVLYLALRPAIERAARAMAARRATP
jgi:uncharacterized protein (DUF2062 family)